MSTLASEVRELDFSNERLDSMRDTYESSKEDVVKTIENSIILLLSILMFFIKFILYLLLK